MFSLPKAPDRRGAVELVAERVGISPGLFYQALSVLERAPPEDLGKLRKGEVAVSNLYKQTQRSEMIEELKECALNIEQILALLDVLQRLREIFSTRPFHPSQIFAQGRPIKQKLLPFLAVAK